MPIHPCHYHKMTINTINIEKIYAEIIDVANRLVFQYWRNLPPFESKGDSSPVTVADKAIETEIRKILKHHTPSFGIYGEEFGVEGIDNEYVWVIDPIDGTKGFLVGGPMFTNLVALTHHKIPIAGLMNVPIMRETYIAVDGVTRMNGKPIRVKDTDNLGTAIGFFSASDMNFTPAQQQITRAFRESVRIHRYCYDSFAYGLLAQGLVHINAEMGMEAYDRMALAPIVIGAGGVMTNWQGEPVSLDSGSQTIAACSPKIHQLGLDIIKKHGI